MALGNAILGARHTAQTIIWQDSDGNAWDLSGGTLTGKMEPIGGGTSRSIDGTLAFTSDGSDGEFTWTYGELDVGTEDIFYVQFKNTHNDGSYDLTEKTEFAVLGVIT